MALQAAERAYAWAEAHPQALYHQDLLNKQYQPAVVTGAYGDRSADDEFFWAASELYLATGKPVYREQVKKHLPTAYKTPSWGNTTALGVFAWLQPGREYQGEDVELANAMKDLLLDYAAEAVRGNRKSVV